MKQEILEKLAMNIVYQLDDDANLSVEFRQKNNDKRITFVTKLIKEKLDTYAMEFLKERLPEKREVEKIVFAEELQRPEREYYKDIGFNTCIDQTLDNANKK